MGDSRVVFDRLRLALCTFETPGIAFDEEGWTSVYSLCQACNLSVACLTEALGSFPLLLGQPYELQNREGVQMIRATRRPPIPEELIVDIRPLSPAYIHPSAPLDADGRDNEPASQSETSLAEDRARWHLLLDRIERTENLLDALMGFVGSVPIHTRLLQAQVVITSPTTAMLEDGSSCTLETGACLHLLEQTRLNWRQARVMQSGTSVWIRCYRS